MELICINLTIFVRICHSHKFAELIFSELDVKHSKDHFKFQVIEYTITIHIKAWKRLLNIDALRYELIFERVSQSLQFLSFVLSMLLVLFDSFTIMNNFSATRLFFQQLLGSYQHIRILD